MSLHVECEHCFSPFKVPEKYAGRTLRCKICGEAMHVPLDSRSDTPEEEMLPLYDYGTSGRPRRVKSGAARKKSSPPVGLAGWLPLLIVGGLFVLFFPIALMVPRFGKVYILFAAFIGCGLYFWGLISLLIVAFKDGAPSGLFCFFLTPIYVIYTLCTDWRKIARPLLRLFAAVGLFFVALTVQFIISPPGRQVAHRPRAQQRQPREERRQPPEKRKHQPTIVLTPTPSPVDDHSPYPLGDVNPKLPAFDAEFHKTTFNGADIYVAHVKPRPGSAPRPADRTQLRVYLPPGAHANGSLPCVLVPPAGTPLFTGSGMDSDPQNPEHIPYVRAGYAVITFSLDGIVGDLDTASMALLGAAYQQFRAADAGLVNARVAFLLAKNELSVVNPRRIYIAGHSSAATLALLYAAHEPELAGCIAYAPVPDVEAHLAQTVSKLDRKAFPGFKEFTRRSSPKTHAAKIRCPIFVYHTPGDTVAPFPKTKAYCDLLKRLGKDITFFKGHGDDHYQNMISEGIPAALDWLSKRPRSPSNLFPTPVIANIPDRRGKTQRPADTTAAAATKPRKGAVAGLRPDRKAQVPRVRPTGKESVPAGTAPLDPAAELTPGMRVVAQRVGSRWEAAEIIDMDSTGNINVHYLRLPSSFDRVLAREQVRLQLPADQIDEELVRKIVFEIRRYGGGGTPDETAIENEFLAVQGYLPGSLKIDQKSQRITLKVIRDSRADKHTTFPLTKAKLVVREIKEPAHNE